MIPELLVTDISGGFHPTHLPCYALGRCGQRLHWVLFPGRCKQEKTKDEETRNHKKPHFIRLAPVNLTDTSGTLAYI